MRVARCFGFVDLCGFTAFTERYGDEHTVAVLANFRASLREIAARRGVRLAKWLGDGAMLAGADATAVSSTVLEVAARSAATAVPLPVRAGLAEGAVIMFEGDDYIGRAANVASRLCDAAEPGVVLASREVVSRLPPWIAAEPSAALELPGFDRPIDASRLAIGVAGSMVRDPLCGLLLPDVAGLPTRFGVDGDRVARFCSDACASAWQERRRPGPHRGEQACSGTDDPLGGGHRPAPGSGVDGVPGPDPGPRDPAAGPDPGPRDPAAGPDPGPRDPAAGPDPGPRDPAAGPDPGSRDPVAGPDPGSRDPVAGR